MVASHCAPRASARRASSSESIRFRTPWPRGAKGLREAIARRRAQCALSGRERRGPAGGPGVEGVSGDRELSVGPAAADTRPAGSGRRESCGRPPATGRAADGPAERERDRRPRLRRAARTVRRSRTHTSASAWCRAGSRAGSSASAGIASSRRRSRRITPPGAGGWSAARAAARSSWRGSGARSPGSDGVERGCVGRLSRHARRALKRSGYLARRCAASHQLRGEDRDGAGEGPCAVAIRRARASPGHDDRVASAPRGHGRCGRRLPPRGVHAARPRVEHDHAPGARDRLLDRADRLCHLARRDRHSDAGGIRFDRVRAASQCTQVEKVHVRKVDARDRECGGQGSEALGGEGRSALAPCSLHQGDRRRSAARLASRETWAESTSELVASSTSWALSGERRFTSAGRLGPDRGPSTAHRARR